MITKPNNSSNKNAIGYSATNMNSIYGNDTANSTTQFQFSSSITQMASVFHNSFETNAMISYFNLVNPDVASLFVVSYFPV